jgi:hypothetical protein
MKTEYLELLHTAITNLKIATGFDTVGVSDKNESFININGIEFCYEIKKTLSNSNIHSTIEQILQNHCQQNTPVVLIANKIYPKLADMLVANRINWMDQAGNCDIRHEGLTVKIVGRKNDVDNQAKNAKKLSEAQIKLILFFLQHPNDTNLPYREIQEKVDLSLGTITKTFDLLKEKKYLVQTENGRRISMRHELIEWWQQQYNEFLKPKLLVSRMSFRTPEVRMKWKEIVLPQGMCWGGDCAAHIVDGYLFPGEYEIYSDIVSTQLLRTGAVMPNPNGEIRIYRKFWLGDVTENIAPLLVIYADLMGAGDSRCLEAALRIKENGI